MDLPVRHGGAALYLLYSNAYLEASNDKMSEVQSLSVV